MPESVTVVIAVRNEESRIGPCLESILQFTGLEAVSWQVWVFDGASEDRTAKVIQDWGAREPRVRYFLNPMRRQAAALNQALDAKPGEFLLWLGAHAEYPADYLSLLLETARRTSADIVGGVLETRVGGPGYGAAVVQALTTHRFGVGGSGFRTGAEEGPADTVPFALYRRSVFERAGRFDERLVRAQDYEFNRRAIAAGAKVWLNPAIVSAYYNQASFWGFLIKQLRWEAPYNAYMWYLAPYAFAPRHAITGVFALGVIGGAALTPHWPWIGWGFGAAMVLYATLAIVAGAQQAARYRDPRHILVLPFAFFLFHFLHGVGVLAGLLRLLTGTAPVQSIREPWPGAGRFRAWPPLPQATPDDAGR